MMAHDDIGVPEALPRTLEGLRERLGVRSVDRLWIFPPTRSGRREQGLIAVSAYHESREERRTVVTASYTAEQTGKGISLEPSFTREGEAPAERFPAVMRGVVVRGGEERGEPREVEIAGSPERFAELLDQLAAESQGMVAT